MRIGMMCHASFGGSGRIGLELALALARHGHRVHLFTRTTPLGGAWEPMLNFQLHTLKADEADEPHPST
ncbi:MAG TPA: NAD-binding protein, partial [Gammaproteobacteria bacterium]|nr:NAD-binding protein [Gammaproteobacteria bacterium]